MYSTEQDAFIDTLRDPIVRDLAWAIGSPSLLDPTWKDYAGHVVDDAWCSQQLKTRGAWLSALDTRPQTLHDFIAQHETRRLGHYFESLISFWLAHTPNLQLIATNLQVHGGGRTLGEYDFLFQDADKNICHWEVAVKFYLQAQPLPELRTFVGPGARDRLDIKLDHVFERQLRLSHTLDGRAALPLGVMPNQTRAFIKGSLFYPANQIDGRLTPPGVSQNHLSGWWIRHPVKSLPHATPDGCWTIKPRLRFLAPMRMDPEFRGMGQDELCATLNAHFATSVESIQVIELQRDADNAWREVSRGFVVHGRWPLIE